MYRWNAEGNIRSALSDRAAHESRPFVNRTTYRNVASERSLTRIGWLLPIGIWSLSLWNAVGVAATAEAIKALETLRTVLNETQSGSKDSGANPMLLPTKPLLGLTRQEIVQGLGRATHDCGSNRDIAGCTRRGELLYSFYELGDHAVGGGPELTLRFDRRGRCVRVSWGLSQ